MGYEISIKRDNINNYIKLEEWLSYINSDLEFELINEYSTKVNYENSLNISSPNTVLWKSRKENIPFTFTQSTGTINVKNPDDRIIIKMIQVSNYFDAKVIGEEEELYIIDKENKLKTIFPKDESIQNKFSLWPFKKKKDISIYKRIVGLSMSIKGNSDSIFYIENIICSLKELGYNTSEIIVNDENSFPYDVYIKDINLNSVENGLIISDETSPEVVYCIKKNDIIFFELNFEYNEERLLQIIEKTTDIPNIIFASVYNNYDNNWQNQESLQVYKINKKKTKGLKFTLDIFDKKCIDISFNPGRTIKNKNITYIAGWKMWFGDGFDIVALKDIKSSNLFIDATEKKGLLEVQLLRNVLYQGKVEERFSQKRLLELLKLE